jgi:hypothetical protein
LVPLGGRFMNPGITDLQDLVPDARLLEQGQAQPLPRSPPAIADDVVNRGQREVLVGEMAMPHPGAHGLAVLPQGDEPAVEIGIPAPLRRTDFCAAKA